MGLRINTNVAALNAARTLNRSTQSLNVSLERLSSGLRINRAKDDAAKVDLSYRAAAVLEDKLGQPDRAFRSYERVL